MEADNVRGIRAKYGGSDEPGGSGAPPDGADDEVSINDFTETATCEDNVIAIAEFDQTTDVQVVDHSLERDFILAEVRKELEKLQGGLKYTLSNPEKESYVALASDPWFKTLSPRVKLAVLQYPPFYLYRMQSTGHHAFIYSYEEAKPKYKDRYAKGKITVTLKLEKEWNQDLLNERMIRFCPLTDLVRLEHRQIATDKRIVSTGAV